MLRSFVESGALVPVVGTAFVVTPMRPLAMRLNGLTLLLLVSIIRSYTVRPSLCGWCSGRCFESGAGVQVGLTTFQAIYRLVRWRTGCTTDNHVKRLC
jgi:hypothetical protein